MIHLQEQSQPAGQSCMLPRSYKIHWGVIGVHNPNMPHSIPFCFLSNGSEWDGIVPEIDLAKRLTFVQIISKSAKI